MTHPAKFRIIGKSTKNWSTKFNRIDLAVRDGIERAFTERETTCKQTNPNERKRKRHNLRNLCQIININRGQSEFPTNRTDQRHQKITDQIKPKPTEISVNQTLKKATKRDLPGEKAAGQGTATFAGHG